MCKRVPGIIFDIVPNCIIRTFNKIIEGTVCFRYPNLTALFCNLSILTKYVE